MFSVIREGSHKSFNFSNFVEKYEICATIWKKGDRISDRRNHKFFGFKNFIGEAESLSELYDKLDLFLSENMKALEELKQSAIFTEVDIASIVDPGEIVVSSLSLPYVLQDKLNRCGLVLSYTVIFSDDD